MSVELLVGIFTVIGVGFTSVFLALNYKKQANIVSGNLVFQINDRLLKPEFKKYSRIISKALDDKKPLKIDNENAFSNYLAELEIISLFVNKKNLDLDFAYEMFGEQILESWECKEVNEFVKIEREKYQQDLYSQLDKIVPKLKEIKIKKNNQ